MEQTREMFQLVKEYCQKQMPAAPYSLWINDIVCDKISSTDAVLIVSSDFRKQIVEEKYSSFLATAFEETLGFPLNITIISEEEKKTAQVPAQLNSVRDDISMDFTSSEYTFDSFIVGSSNNFAHAASLAVATNPASSYNPLFIYGGSGLGKTHLLNAICNEISKNIKDAKIIYVKGEDFTNELIAAIRTETTRHFHDKYRQADVLLVDDIQFISGKESTQEEFFHTFNALYEANKQIVLTSDRPPKEIKTLEDRLRSRFESGLIADVQPPDYETRIAILRRKAELLDIVLPDDVLEFIANKLKTNIRQLEGTVKKIKAFKLLTNSPPSISIAQTSIKDILSDSQPVSVTIDRILNEVSRYFEVTPQEIRSMTRTASVSMARQASMYIIREITGLSMTSIGAEFSGRDHSTVVYTINQTKKLMKSNPHFKNTVEDVIKNVRDS